MTHRSETEKLWCKRLREAQAHSGISQTIMAKQMTERLGVTWRQSRVWKLLWCEMPITLQAYEAAAETLGLKLDDLIRPRAGAGMVLDEYETKLVILLRQTQTTDYAYQLVTTLLARPVEDGRAMNGKRAQSA